MYHRSLDLSHPLLWTVEGVLSAAECEALIDRIEAVGFELAPVTTLRGPVMRPELRNNHRAVLDDPELAALLFARVRDHVPATLAGMTAVGANERLRCYRYDPGERFAPHFDGAFRRDAGEESLLTFMLYLNDGFDGGATAFLDLGFSVAPRPGLALFFQHMLLHEGCLVHDGVKYAMRSDIMYRKT